MNLTYFRLVGHLLQKYSFLEKNISYRTYMVYVRPDVSEPLFPGMISDNERNRLSFFCKIKLFFLPAPLFSSVLHTRQLLGDRVS
jgi:hypothetical protein